MTFSHPAWLIAGAFACLVLLWMWRRYDKRQYAELARFVSGHLREQLTQSVSVARRRARRGLMLAAVALLFVALAGPLLGFRWELVNRHGNEIIFAVDTSRSMSTPDVKPDRLTRAKFAIDDFTNKLDGDAVGLVAFAGSAYLVCPITLDYGAFHESLSALDTNTIPRPGTNIAAAIREAQMTLQRRPGADKVLILVTDGEDLEGDALLAAKAAANQDGLKIYTIGVGTPSGDLIPLSTGQATAFVKDDAGNFVKSKLDEAALKDIASATGGLYAPLGAQGEGFDTLYKLGLAPMLKHDIASRRQKIYTQRFQWPLAASLAMLLLSLLVGNRRRVPKPKAVRARKAGSSVPRAAAVSALIVFFALSLLLGSHRARSSTSSAQDAYVKGDFATAARDYEAAAKRDPNQPVLQFNRGTAAYRAGQFPQAAQAFQESITRAPASDPKRLRDQQDAYYNLGNTLYRSGQQIEKSSPPEAIKTWTEAVKAYDTALQLRADDADSKYNRDLVKRKIDALKQNQQNPPQGQGQNDPNQKGQPNQQQSPQQSGGAPKPDSQQQQPPPQQPGQPNQQPPQQQPGQPNQAPPPKSQPGQGQPKPASGNLPAQDQSGADEADVPRAPGQMSRDEARQLLDSVKSDEKRALGPPAAINDAYSPPPDKPKRDW
ncbi:MAG: VWA domain-containing protein [Pseudomonadota bacterium]|nr:VWA domain-containing protein [Pseudomonadota bacterium]